MSGAFSGSMKLYSLDDDDRFSKSLYKRRYSSSPINTALVMTGTSYCFLVGSFSVLFFII